MKSFAYSAILTGGLAASVSACDVCAIYSASEARGELGKGAFAGVSEQFSHFGTVQVDGRKVADPSGQYFDSSISQLFVGYNFSERVGVQFNLPVIYRSFQRPDNQGGIQSGTESGIGDVSLLGNFVGYLHESKRSTFRWNILGGVKFPTGSSSRIGEELEEIHEPIGPPSGIHGHDLTLGSGSVDGIVGASMFARWRRGFLMANVQYAIRSKGDFDYQFANDLTWSGGPGYLLLLNDKYTLGLQAVVSGEHKGLDTFRGQPAPDTGVTAVYLGPQLNFTWQEHLSAQLGVDLPMSIDNTSLQTVLDYRIRAGLTWHF